MQSCFILKRRIWSPWSWCGCKPRHLPVALRKGCVIPKYPSHPCHHPHRSSSSSPHHECPTLSDKSQPSFLRGRLSLRLLGAACDGVWPFASPHNRLLRADKGQGGPRRPEGPRLSFLFPCGKTLCLRVPAVLLWCAEVGFFSVVILFRSPGASAICGLIPPPLRFWNTFSHYLFPILSSCPSGTLIVHMFNHLT